MSPPSGGSTSNSRLAVLLSTDLTVPTLCPLLVSVRVNPMISDHVTLSSELSERLRGK